MEPTIRKIKLSKPYVVHPDTGQIYHSYEVVVKWPDGKREVFGSEEEAKARVEGRSVSQSAIDAEVPEGYLDALEKSKPKPELLIHEEKEQDEFNVILISFNDKKISVIKAVRVLTGLGLKESKALVESVPVAIKEPMSKGEAEDIRAILVAAGASIEIQ